MGKKNDLQASYELLQGMERRFKKIAGLANEDLTPFPIKQVSNQKINKDKSKEFGEVFTPLCLVDSMIKQAKIKKDHTTLDLCAGYGQFSIRLFRAYFLKFRKSADFDFKKFMKQHCFSELQLSSCFKLLRIFGLGINLFIGDAMQLGKVPENANGIWLYVEEADRWVCITESIKKMISGDQVDSNGNKLPVSEEMFVKKVETLTAYLNATFTDGQGKRQRDNGASVKAIFAGKKFDLVLSNPPYNDGLDLKILLALINAQVAKEYVVVHPATWLIDLKHRNQSFNDFRSSVSGKVRSVRAFNGNTIFGIELFVPCVVTHIVANHSGDIKVEYFADKYSVNSIEDITKFGKDWDSVVCPLFRSIKTYVQAHGSVWSKNVKRVGAGKFHCQFGTIRGTPVREKNNAGNMYKDDFFTIARKDDGNKQISKAMNNAPGPTFEFDTEKERDNFLAYMRTDFARFCLSLLKNNGNLAVGEMELVPWLDFTQSWDDDKLFTHFNIDQATQDYIRAFLPDYYGLRSFSSE
jgi:hypothetical protein